VPENTEPSVQEASSQDGDDGIYGETVDSLHPSTQGEVMTYELQMPVFQTSEEPSEGSEDIEHEEFRGDEGEGEGELGQFASPEDAGPAEGVTTADLEKIIDEMSFSEEGLEEIPGLSNALDKEMPEYPEDEEEEEELPEMEGEEEHEESYASEDAAEDPVDESQREEQVEEEVPEMEQESEAMDEDEPQFFEEEVEAEGVILNTSGSPAPSAIDVSLSASSASDVEMAEPVDTPEDEEPVTQRDDQRYNTTVGEDVEDGEDEYDDDEEESEVSDTVYDDFDEEGAKPVRKGAFEDKGTIENAFRDACAEFEDTLALTKRFEEMASNRKTQPTFQGKMLSTRNRIHMVQENINSFRDTFMHAIFIELRAKCKILIRKGKLKQTQGVQDVLGTLGECIEMVKDKAKDYQRHFYQDLFLPSVVNRVVRGPIYPFVPVEDVLEEDGLPNYFNPMGRLIQQVITRGVLSLDVSYEPFSLSCSSWKKIDLGDWDTDSKDLKRAYKREEVLEERASHRGPQRRRTKSPLSCALTGIPIFPGDMIHAARLVFRDSLSGTQKNAKYSLSEKTHCLLFHSEIEQYVAKPSPTSQQEQDALLDDDCEEEMPDEEDMSKASRSIITSFLHSLSIIADSYYPSEEDGNSGRSMDHSRGTTVWFMSQARALLSSLVIPMVDVDSENASIKYILSSNENFIYFIEEVLFLKDYLKMFGTVYAQHKFAIYNVRHLLGMND
jgi:hypothetical protein